MRRFLLRMQMEKNRNSSQCKFFFNFRINVFTEKVQSRLYSISNIIIKSTLEKRKREEEGNFHISCMNMIPDLRDVNMAESQ